MTRTRSIRRVGMLSVHTSPLATLGGKKTGGMNVYVRDLARELSRRGVAVDIFTRRIMPVQPDIRIFAEHARVVHVPAGPVSDVGTAGVYPYLPEFVEYVLEFQAQEQVSYDIIFSHYWLSGWVAHELRARWGTPVAQMFHTLGRMKNRIAQAAIHQEADIRIFTETDIMSWADVLIAATPAERAQLLWLYRADARRIEIVPPGVDLDRFHPIAADEARAEIGVPDGHRMLLFVGRIEPLKGVDNLIRAAALLMRHAPDVMRQVCVCVIGGDTDDIAPDTELARLITLRDELGVSEHVVFLGARDQDMLQYYYAAAEALIMPSDYESFGMVALEAMACGTPVIASEVGGLAFLVEDGVTGFHVPTREPSALADSIYAVLTDRSLRETMRFAAQRRAAEYAWPRVTNRLLHIWERLNPIYEQTVRVETRQQARRTP